MGLQSSDLILVERSNTLYKETYGNKANIDSSDLLLVERTDGNTGIGTLYKETKSNWDFAANIDIHSANYMVTLGTLLYNQGSNNDNPFSVVEVQAEFSSSATVGDGTLYIGFRNSATTSFYGDLPIAGIQILQSNGTTIRNPGSGSAGYWLVNITR